MVGCASLKYRVSLGKLFFLNNYFLERICAGDCFRGAPAVWPQESEELYKRRTEAFWQQRAREVAEGEGLRVTDKQVTKAARRMVTEFFALNQQQ